MCLPSGEKVGVPSNMELSVSCMRPVPSAFITQICKTVVSRASCSLPSVFIRPPRRSRLNSIPQRAGSGLLRVLKTHGHGVRAARQRGRADLVAVAARACADGVGVGGGGDGEALGAVAVDVEARPAGPFPREVDLLDSLH